MKNSDKLYFRLFENCVLVKGKLNSIICDLQRNELMQINTIQLNILESLRNKPILYIEKSLDEENLLYFKSFIEFLIQNDLGHITKTPELFPILEAKWKSPFNIVNAVIDRDDLEGDELTSIFNQLIELRCPFIQLRIWKPVELDKLGVIISITQNTRIQSIELLLQADNKSDPSDEEVKRLIDGNERITRILICGAKSKREIIYRGFPILYSAQSIKSEKCCGQIQKSEFGVNVLNYMESQMFNSCLNRKVSIDSNGYIRNCPSMPDVFGNIRNTSLLKAIEKRGFKKYWDINKDKIHVCKDCEFRYVCTDCRAYVEDPEDLLSKPLKCGYNPYTGEWSEWSTNPLKQKAIQYYGMEEIVAERLSRIQQDAGHDEV